MMDCGLIFVDMRAICVYLFCEVFITLAVLKAVMRRPGRQLKGMIKYITISFTFLMVSRFIVALSITIFV